MTAGRTVAIIPARGGSKGVPGKNLERVGGVPLVGRAVAAALASERVDSVYVSTDDADIAAAAREAGAQVVTRPADISGDTATSESALLHALAHVEAADGPVEVIAFLQATSPFTPALALAEAVARVQSGQEDVVFSAVETYAFLWREGEDGAVGVNHDHGSRPRRQDREPHYQETGAFYVMNAAGFRAAQFRFFGRVGVVEVPPETALEIDTPEELAAARAMAGRGALEGPITARALVMDFDGVHTDDTATVDQNGVESVVVSRSDGMGISLLRDAGVPLLILSKETNPVVAARAAKLRVDVRHGIDDKVHVLREWVAERGLDLADVAYVGNDINDAGCLEIVGWPVVVPDAHPSVLPLARVVLERRGGHGALRELADRILGAR